jgi:hypothetical protein
LNTTTNHSDSSAYSEVTANAVINEQLSGSSAQSSNPAQVLEVQEEFAFTDCHSHTSKPLRRKKSTKPKLSKGDAQVEIPESLPGKTSNRSLTRMTPPRTERMVCRR